nr:hypothetical protein Iba_chr05bCG6920 [Ipomoea batatas]
MNAIRSPPSTSPTSWLRRHLHQHPATVGMFSGIRKPSLDIRYVTISDGLSSSPTSAIDVEIKKEIGAFSGKPSQTFATPRDDQLTLSTGSNAAQAVTIPLVTEEVGTSGRGKSPQAQLLCLSSICSAAASHTRIDGSRIILRLLARRRNRAVPLRLGILHMNRRLRKIWSLSKGVVSNPPPPPPSTEPELAYAPEVSAFKSLAVDISAGKSQQFSA